MRAFAIAMVAGISSAIQDYRGDYADLYLYAPEKTQNPFGGNHNHYEG